jgi:hypothetical protein
VSRKIIAIPLDPAVLAEDGVLKPFPLAAFDPAGEWDQTFRIVGSRGYHHEHFTVGWLRLRRTGVTAEGFGLQLEERIAANGGTESRLSISMECLNDPWATPRRWTWKNEFFDVSGDPVRDLGGEIEGRADGDRLRLRQRGEVTRRRLRGPWTISLNLLEAVQRREPAASEPASAFTLLEDFRLSKPGQTLVYTGTVPADLPVPGPTTLHRFTQVGQGLLPIDYCLDEQRRLLLVTSMNKALILDRRETAESQVEELLERGRRFQRTRGSA